MGNAHADLLQGSLDLLIVESLLLNPLHGWAISKRIRELSAEVLEVNQGPRYSALYRLEERGWRSAEWGTSLEGRRVRVYRLTARGTTQLVAEREQRTRFTAAVDRVLNAT